MPKEKPQSQKFKDLAREVECDEDEKAFEEKLKRIIKQPKNQESKESAD